MSTRRVQPSDSSLRREARNNAIASETRSTYVSNMDEIGQFYVSSPGDGIKMSGGAFAANTSGITAAIFTGANAATFLARERRGMYPA